MDLAYPKQKFQDWCTQQWVICGGTKIDPEKFSWLMGPFGNIYGIGEEFINQLAQKENLLIEREKKSHGLIPSIKMLNLTEHELSFLSPKVIEFYEHTAQYHLALSVHWNPFFKFFGILVNNLFSNRINQLNIPTNDGTTSLNNEIITLVDPASNTVQYTIWLRTSHGQVIYSGLYGTCTLPSGKTCIKAVFPLPQGNATVIMSPSVGANGEMILDSSGKKIGDAGFYFLLKDSNGNYWTKFVGSFRDRLTIGTKNEHLFATQLLTIWNYKAVTFNYNIERI